MHVEAHNGPRSFLWRCKSLGLCILGIKPENERQFILVRILSFGEIVIHIPVVRVNFNVPAVSEEEKKSSSCTLSREGNALPLEEDDQSDQFATE